MRLPGQQDRQDLGNAVDRLDDERDPEFLGKRLRQVEFRPGWAIGTDRVRGRAVTRNDPELPGLEHLVEYGRPRGTGPDQSCQRDDEQ